MSLRGAARYWPAVAFLAFAALPFFPGKDAGLYAQDFLPLFIYAILALGLNVLVGDSGILHLGIAAFFGIGAYAAGILMVQQFPFQQSFLVAALAATIAAAVTGVIATAPTLRLRGDYLVLVTMAFGLIAVFLIRNLDHITNATRGLTPIRPTLLPSLEDPNLADYRLQPMWKDSWRDYPYFYFLCLGLLAVVFIGLGNLERSRLGRSWVAMREDELAVSCMGLNPARLKLIAIATGAGLAGLAGALYAVAMKTTAGPGPHDFNRSMQTLCCVILGGMGNRSGVLLGVLLLIGFDQVLTPLVERETQRQFPQSVSHYDFLKISMWRMGIFGIVLILVMRFRPAGLLPASRVKHEFGTGDRA